MSKLKMCNVDECAQYCLNLFENLPKSGKPTENEWTVLSCVLQYDSNIDKLDVVSLGTGSKCIGASKMSPSGDILNDSHAEVIARRGFLLYVYDNIDKTLQNKNSIFIRECNRFMLKDNIHFIFFSSQLPCGDASIFPKSEEEQYGDILQNNKRKADNDESEIEEKRSTLSDIHRTGAKCLPQNEQDGRGCGVQYHLLGQVRTKPGRGDRTLSVSCSDKMAKWIHMGLQGRLLDLFLVEPIFITRFIFGSGVPYSEESLNRALLKRDPKQSVIAKFVPEFVQTSVIFPHVKSEKTVRPAAGSIIWTKARDGLSEVAVQGRRQGVTKKKAISLSCSLSISKYNMYRKFQDILCKDEHLRESIASNIDIPYNTMKEKATRYDKNWQFVKSIFFKTWTIKPDIWDFRVNVI
ncbi:tRNA-specific adenosine deaminase 1 [Plodia interpunctella]|uniref:tRNA-specific adenosine deaminase 1 n=1 Tax=Plodia interpunctella TaxID=58824 RepID=UPI002367D98D|nr:tRNA-specific adenosine deaminase 1 [Plodia interpunctella]XP_053603718.1 tRNA-specific adenosine deaminase 1 [Plodia interpunctella]